MNKIWEYLGIEPTKDKKEIRKAFAAQSRLHHPEEEPEYFAQLNQAYKEALKGTEEKSGDAPAKGRPETGRISGETMDGGLEEPSSLLLKLEKAREEAIQESMEKGALSGLILLFGTAAGTSRGSCREQAQRQQKRQPVCKFFHVASSLFS